jgi:hypothetical protein
MISITNYTLKVNSKNGKTYVKCIEISFCSICGNDLTFKDHRARIVIYSDGIHVIIMIRRLKCKICNKLHNELPDFIQPYKRYTSDVIEAVLDDDTSSSPAENSTIKRWRKWFDRIASYLNAALVAIKAEFEHLPVNIMKELTPLEYYRKQGKDWLRGIMRRYVNFGNNLSEIT